MLIRKKREAKSTYIIIRVTETEKNYFLKKAGTRNLSTLLRKMLGMETR